MIDRCQSNCFAFDASHPLQYVISAMMTCCYFNPGLPVQNYTLIPRVKGTQLAIQSLGDHFDAVYDVTIAYGSTRVTHNSLNRKEAPSLSRKLN